LPQRIQLTADQVITGATASPPTIPRCGCRLARFLEDWKLFRDRDWPILGYEQFVRAPEPSLQTLCTAIDLPWDAAMLSWPKPANQIADARYGNPTFHKPNMAACSRPASATYRNHTDRIP